MTITTKLVRKYVFHDEVSLSRYVGQLTRPFPSVHTDSSSPYFAGPAVPREDSDGTTLAHPMLDRCPGGRRGRNGAPPKKMSIIKIESNSELNLNHSHCIVQTRQCLSTKTNNF